MREIIRTTLIGGVVFLIPVAAIAMIIGKAFQFLKIVATPLANLIPINSLAGLALVELLTALLLLVVCLLAGLIAKSKPAQRVYRRIDKLLLLLIPGYSWVKGVTGDISDTEAKELFRPVFIRLDDQYQLGLEARRTDDGLVAVYLPGAPDMRSGTLAYVTADRVQAVDVGFKEFSKAFTTLGRASLADVSPHTA